MTGTRGRCRNPSINGILSYGSLSVIPMLGMVGCYKIVSRCRPVAGEKWQYVSDRDQQAAVDGGSGEASVMLDQSQDQYQAAIVKTMAMRTQSDPAADPPDRRRKRHGPGWHGQRQPARAGQSVDLNMPGQGMHCNF